MKKELQQEIKNKYAPCFVVLLEYSGNTKYWCYDYKNDALRQHNKVQQNFPFMPFSVSMEFINA